MHLRQLSAMLLVVYEMEAMAKSLICVMIARTLGKGTGARDVQRPLFPVKV